MKEFLITCGLWLLVMALIGIALLLTKKIADVITSARSRSDKKDTPQAGGEFRNPYYVSESEIADFKKQTEEFNNKNNENTSS